MTPGTQLGSYEILSAIGKGGMGEVWRARDSKLGREVAIKTLTEAEIWGALFPQTALAMTDEPIREMGAPAPPGLESLIACNPHIELDLPGF